MSAGLIYVRLARQYGSEAECPVCFARSLTGVLAPAANEAWIICEHHKLKWHPGSIEPEPETGTIKTHRVMGLMGEPHTEPPPADFQRYVDISPIKWVMDYEDLVTTQPQ